MEAPAAGPATSPLAVAPAALLPAVFAALAAWVFCAAGAAGAAGAAAGAVFTTWVRGGAPDCLCLAAGTAAAGVACVA